MGTGRREDDSDLGATAPADGAGVVAEELGVEALPAVEHSFKAIAIKDKAAGALAHGAALFDGLPHQADHGSLEGESAACCGEHAGLAVGDDLARAGNIGCDGGEGADGCLKKSHGQAFPARGKDEAVGGLHPAANIGLEAEEADAAGQIELGGEQAELGFERARAGDDQAGGVGELDHGLKECGVVLDGIEAAGSDPKKLVCEAEFGAEAGAGRSVGLPRGRVDAIGEY